MPRETHYAWCRDTLFRSGADAFNIGTPRTKSSVVHEGIARAGPISGPHALKIVSYRTKSSGVHKRVRPATQNGLIRAPRGSQATIFSPKHLERLVVAHRLM